MNQGVIYGGWEFVWLAYIVTAVMFIAYTISLVARLRGGKRT